jgi:hypothetical protein
VPSIFDGDGAYDDVLDPGPSLPTPWISRLITRARCSFGCAAADWHRQYTYDPEFRDELTDVDGDDVTLNKFCLRSAM